MTAALGGFYASAALVGVLLALIGLTGIFVRQAPTDGYVYVWWPVRESVFIHGSEGRRLWIVTKRWLWRCDAWRVVLDDGSCHYAKVPR